MGRALLAPGSPGIALFPEMGLGLTLGEAFSTQPQCPVSHPSWKLAEWGCLQGPGMEKVVLVDV